MGMSEDAASLPPITPVPDVYGAAWCTAQCCPWWHTVDSRCTHEDGAKRAGPGVICAPWARSTAVRLRQLEER